MLNFCGIVAAILKIETGRNVLLHCDEWGRFVAPSKHKFVTGATLLQLVRI